MARSSDRNDKLQMRLAFGAVRLDGDPKAEADERKQTQ